jgi:hypothetical protein
MNKRVCEGCRFYESPNNDGYGFCRRNPPVGDGSELPEVGLKDWCGEWRDKTVSPEQEERRELVRRFALVLVVNPRYSPDDAWEWAVKLADAEPKIGDAPTEQRRYVCERCGGSGVQPAGLWSGKAYDSLAGRCELCAEPSSDP